MSIIACSAEGCERVKIRYGHCEPHLIELHKSGSEFGLPACAWPDCELLGLTRSMCSKHYARAKIVKDYEAPWVAWEVRESARSASAEARKNAICIWPGCEAKGDHARGFCKPDYQRATNMGTFHEPWKLWNPGGNCVVCGIWFDGTIHGQKFCSSRCNMLNWKSENAERVRELGREHVRRRRAVMRGLDAEKFTDKQVRERSGDKCYLCGRSIKFSLRWPDPMSPSVDHITPLSKGGSHTLDNVAMTHVKCNMDKNARLVEYGPQISLF